MRHALDRPIWSALSSLQAGFSIGTARALRYQEDVAPFIAARDDCEESLLEMAQLLVGGRPCITLQVGRCPVPAGIAQVSEKVGVQLVATAPTPVHDGSAVEKLSEADAPEMVALASITQPGPFLPRTHQLGQFWGIRDGGRIVAMAGERMKLPGFAEVSGVCCHPDARGKGHARTLSMVVMSEIVKRGEIPFLHAYADNHAAVRLYRSLGFAQRAEVRVQVLSA